MAALAHRLHQFATNGRYAVPVNAHSPQVAAKTPDLAAIRVRWVTGCLG